MRFTTIAAALALWTAAEAATTSSFATISLSGSSTSAVVAGTSTPSLLPPYPNPANNQHHSTGGIYPTGTHYMTGGIYPTGTRYTTGGIYPTAAGTTSKTTSSQPSQSTSVPPPFVGAASTTVVQGSVLGLVGMAIFAIMGL